MDDTLSDSITTDIQSDTPQTLEFTGTIEQETFDNYADQLYKDAKDAGISPIQQIFLSIHVNAIYGSSMQDSGGSLTGVFKAIAGLTGMKDLTLSNGSKIVMGNVSDTRQTVGDGSAKQYRLPHIVKV
jgi:microcystin degradation protein MlrC